MTIRLMKPLNLPLKTKKSAGVPVTAKVRAIISNGDAARDAGQWEKASTAYKLALNEDPARLQRDG
jgi:hypothetical protein